MDKRNNNEWKVKQKELLGKYLISLSTASFTGMVLVAVVEYLEEKWNLATVGVLCVGLVFTALLFVGGLYEIRKSNNLRKLSLTTEDEEKPSFTRIPRSTEVHVESGDVHIDIRQLGNNCTDNRES